MKISPQNTIIIATFSPWQKGIRLPINGNLEPMRDFFIKKSNDVVIIDQPYPGSDFVIPNYEVYKNGKLKENRSCGLLVKLLQPLLTIRNTSKTHISFKLRDFLSVFDVVLRKNHTDIFIGFEAINSLAGIILKKFRKISIVIYYVSDYSPYRYGKTWFNSLYLWLDRFCAMNADYIWDVSPAMQKARIQKGLIKEKSAQSIVVPNALYPSQINKISDNEVVPYSIVYIGTLGPENGPQLIVEALPFIVQKFRKCSLHIFGGPEEIGKSLLAYAKKLDCSNNIKYHGFISDRTRLSQSIRKYYIAVAPYTALPLSVRWYADATKIRAYMASGIPVITTQVPPLGKDVIRYKAGLVVTDSAHELSTAVIKLFNDKKLWHNLRNNAYRYAQNNTWDKEYVRAFNKMK